MLPPESMHALRPRGWPVRPARAAAVAVLTTTTAIGAHVMAGGQAPVVVVACVLAGTFAVALASSGRRLATSQLIGLLVLGQAGTHVACAAQSSGAMSARMLLGHALATLVTTALMRRGEDVLFDLAERLGLVAIPTTMAPAIVAKTPAPAVVEAPVAMHDVILAYVLEGTTGRRVVTRSTHSGSQKVHSLMTRIPARLCAALITALFVLLAAPANAHVSVSSTDASSGGFGKIVFRVPTESDTAATTKIEVTLPEDQPLSFVSAQPKTGWSVEVKKAKLTEPITSGDATITTAVRTITWMATGDGIAPGQFDEFAISGGPLPDAKEMSFVARQSYDDGSVVAWDQPMKEGAEEPEHPAPTLSLAAASADDAASTPKNSEYRDSDDDGNGWTMATSVVAVVLAAGALVMSLRQNRRRA